MSFVTAIRDYVETLNTVSESLNQNLTLTTFAAETAQYILKTVQAGLLYIASFQWIRDFTLLPIVLPQLSTAIFKETFVLETGSKVFFDFLEIPDLHQNKFLLGIFNSFFLSLPVSILHVVAIRRLLIQGIPSATWSIGGYLLGQIFFITCTVFGLRSILVPWLTLEPLSYLLGVILIFRTIYSMVSENLVEIKGWTSPSYKNFFVTSFLLAWCEQTSIFQYLGNLTFSSNVSILETFSMTSPLSSFVTHFFYILGILIGAMFFTCLWGFVFLQVKNAFLIYTPLFLSSFIQKINKATFVTAIALSLTSIPFYGFDYLVTGPLGFISQDSVFKNTILDQTRLKDFRGVGLLSSAESNYMYLDVDPSPFDRGDYLTAPNAKQSLSFEDLNYRGEFDWTSRIDKKSTLTESKSGFFSLSKVFKKQQKTKTQAQQIEIQNDKWNQVIPEKSEGFDPALVDSHSPSIERYLEESALSTSGLEEIKAYQELYKTSFPPDFFRKDSSIEKEIEQKIKQKYYSNPVYKSLLALDIDLFLKRQPTLFQLNSQQENDLYTKRQMLESYYDSLRHYANLSIDHHFEPFFDGTKSFSSKVYNQQFKGTLRSVRRLFSLTTNNDQDSEKSSKTILKFDQPGYDFSDKNSFSAYHEELDSITNARNFEKMDKNVTLQQSDQSQSIQQENMFARTPSFFTNPLYAGWDEKARKFVITNKFLPRSVAGYKVKGQPAQFEPKWDKNRTQLVQHSEKRNQTLKFTTWPLSFDQVAGLKTNSTIPYVTLFETLSDKTKEILTPSSQVSYLPANLKRYELQQLETQSQKEPFASLAPKRGGFVWPGKSQPAFSSLFQNFKKS